ncbi:uncharacterized protein SCHCODRAFT_02638133 [Schizophyllum commune H4-8]|uniref:Uncharacterized protein n=1 Tax=Schizophyllum commune (strain H4-8 / FGSC 9210) TaxID=578458 RepID=D8QF14_SCHCM|nr:uncharacterized protein SCHCODRAFT_02638133 [Schizophyllum commune H4-8]KAI5887441.1 hypothetical protein SCHCODRAFT_02638133 [Schizophyllum commune H4-8]
MPAKQSSKKAKTRVTAHKRSAARPLCPRPRKKPALSLTDRSEANSSSEDELNAFREHDRGVSLDELSSPSRKDATRRTPHFRPRPGAQAFQPRQPPYYPSPPCTPRSRTRAPGSDDWWPRASSEDSKDGTYILASSAPSYGPQNDLKTVAMEAADQVSPEDAQNPPADIDQVSREETRTFLAAFGMHDYATMFHAKGLRTRADYVTFALDCQMNPDIVHGSLAGMFPTIPERKCRSFSWVLCQEVREELAQSARDVERILCEATGDSSDADEERGDADEKRDDADEERDDADEERGDMDAEDGGSAMDSADEVAELLGNLVDEMEGDDEEG